MKINKTIVFSDMDGTFLDHDSYSYKKTIPALKKIGKNKASLVFCSSRVRTEIEPYYKELGLKEPFISENGAAIFIPKDYFDFEFKYDYIKQGYKVIKLGTKYNVLRKALIDIRKKTRFKFKGFGDLTDKELAKDAVISLKKAKIAKKREFTEPFILIDGDISLIKKKIKEKKLNYTKGGRYHYIMGNNDKGKAVKVLTQLFKKQYKIKTIGIGDGKNDLPMLRNVDKGYLVKNHKGKYSFNDKKIKRVAKIGPQGFNAALTSTSFLNI